MSDTKIPSSFRDPSGFVFIRDGALLRRVNEIYREDYLHLMTSGLYESLVGDSLLIPHEELEDAPTEDGGFAVLAPQRVPFISYPYEWCFGQLKDAALATLRIQSRALDHGMSLRDASAYNIQFVHGKPVLIDTLSFERLREGTPWVAYRQFCQHFLAPLALMSLVDVRLGQLSRIHLDGIPLDLAAALLPGRSRLRPSLLVHVHSHAHSQRRHAGKRAQREDLQGRFSMRAFRGLIDSLQSAVEQLRWQPKRSQWVGYYSEGDSYSEDGLLHKQQIVRRFLEERRPRVVWDLGANTALFSRLAAEQSALTVAFDADPGAVETSYRNSKGVLPLVVDLTNPSPAIGWANRERLSLAERGPADTALVLAIVHHLAIANNVPLPQLADTLSELCRSLVIEFVPKTDPKVQLLLAARDDIFFDYHEAAFEDAFRARFSIDDRVEVRGSNRAIYLMRRK